MTGRDALILGRVSNLPTVWTNVLTGVSLAGTEPWQPATLVLALLISMMYIAGMYLNDAFDRDIDRRERPDRPIPAGRVQAKTVFVLGFGMLTVPVAAFALWSPGGADGGISPALAAALLAVTILAYDIYHKSNRFSPVVMGLCRALIYITAGVTVVGLPVDLMVGAFVLWCYLIGLSYAAKQEALGRIGSLWPLGFLAVPFLYGLPLAFEGTVAALIYGVFLLWVAWAVRRLLRRRPGDVPGAVAALLAGICLLDALLIAGFDGNVPALVALGLFPLTLLAQRYVPAT
jgi:4-hydroxybenzoate polyprenyltransferase